MLTIKKIIFSVLVPLGWGMIGAAPAGACDVPVFRYALERWHSRPYQVVIFHRGGLSAGERRAADYLRQAATEQGGNANMAVRIVDLSASPTQSMRALLPEQEAASLPKLVVAYPAGSSGQVALWSAPLSMSAAKAVTDSPLRSEIARRLMGGDSAVWVLIEGDRPDKNDATAKLLASQLAKISKSLKLPAAMYESHEAIEANLEVKFSWLKASRTDPAERMLITMLLQSEEDLERRYVSELIAFPIFGRGRVLYALVGKGISAENILEACHFLAGPCACNAEAGWELLINAPWQEAIKVPLVDRFELPDVIAAPAKESDGNGLATPPDQPPDKQAYPPANYSPLVRNTLISLGFIVLVVGIIIILVVSKRSTRS